MTHHNQGKELTTWFLKISLTLKPIRPLTPKSRHMLVSCCVFLTIVSVKKGIGSEPQSLLMPPPFVHLLPRNLRLCANTHFSPRQASLKPWPPHTHTFFSRQPRLRVRSANWSRIISSLIVPCSNGVPLLEKIFLHPIPPRLWCFLLSSSVDLAFLPVTFSADSLVTTRLNSFI
jgi:hypothetical protein